jgi:exo-beta-1,3-glucanase (GH17 family)
MAQDPETPRPGLARRTFLQYSAGAAGLLLGAGSVLEAYARGLGKGGPLGVVVENTLNPSEEGQSDGPGPMEGARVHPQATRFVYTGFDGDGTVRFGPLSGSRAESQLCPGVPLDVSTMTVEYQDANGVKLDDAIIRGVQVVPGGTVTFRAAGHRLDSTNKWTARSPYPSSFNPFSGNLGICYGGTSAERGTVLDDLHTMMVVDGFKMIHIYHLFTDQLTIDPTSEAVLQYAQANGIEILMGTRNVVASELLQTAAGAATYVAAIWPYLAAGVIKVIAPGNEVNDRLRANIDPEIFARAVKNLRGALAAAGFPNTPISVTLQYGGLTSYPPGGATFQDSPTARSMQPYIAAVRSVNTQPFVFVNIHPSYTVEDVVSRVPSTASWFPMFGLFTSTVDPATNDPKEAPYWNLLDLQYNTVLTAMRNAGINGVQVFLSESGWPSAGGGPYTTPASEASYVDGLVNSWVLRQARGGDRGVPTFLFEAFDEPTRDVGQASWGLRTVDGTLKPGIVLPQSASPATSASPAKSTSGSRSASAADAVTYVPTFTETFSSLDSLTDNWVREDIRDPAGSPTEYKPDHVTLVPGGGLRLVVTRRLRSNGEWIAQSGRTRSTFRQKYGLFLFRARQIPKGADATSPLRHLWPALWTVGEVDLGENVWPIRGEIDVMETILSVAQRPDFTSRLMIRTEKFPPEFSSSPVLPWFASVPSDASPDIKGFLTAEQWKQSHTFAVDWYQVRDGAGTVTDVMFDFYLDAMVNDSGNLRRIDDPASAPVKLHSYSLKQSTEEHDRTEEPAVPDWRMLDDEWGKQAFVLNVCVGGAWDPDNKEITRGTWQPPTDGSANMIVDGVECYERTAP